MPLLIDLNALDREAVVRCFTPRQVYAKAQTVAKTDTERAVLAYLLEAAVNLTAMSCKLAQAYAEDSYDSTTAHQAGLGPDRASVLAAASTCAHNAGLFLQEAQRRSALRSSGYDPLIAP
ncbi:hypothetical protein ACFY36_36095 [Actinoplanes sp. NPDC000266]